MTRRSTRSGSGRAWIVAFIATVCLLAALATRCAGAGPDVGAGPPAPSASPPSTVPALAALTVAALTVAPEGSRAGYDRDAFRHWVDADGDGCNTRCEVLEAERVASLPGLTEGGWSSAWDGYATADPSELDIDHLVGLAEAWESGASGWDDARREAFANDLDLPDSLVAVTAVANRSKGDRDPAEWQPRAQAAWCQFGLGWIATKEKWGLTADAGEVRALTNIVQDC